MIVFQSDNGAEGATYEAIPTMGENLMRVIHEYCEYILNGVWTWMIIS